MSCLHPTDRMAQNKNPQHKNKIQHRCQLAPNFQPVIILCKLVPTPVQTLSGGMYKCPYSLHWYHMLAIWPRNVCVKTEYYLDVSKGSKVSTSRGTRRLRAPRWCPEADRSAVLNLAMKLSRRELNWNVNSRSSTSIALHTDIQTVRWTDTHIHRQQHTDTYTDRHHNTTTLTLIIIIIINFIRSWQTQLDNKKR